MNQQDPAAIARDVMDAWPGEYETIKSICALFLANTDPDWNYGWWVEFAGEVFRHENK